MQFALDKAVHASPMQADWRDHNKAIPRIDVAFMDDGPAEGVLACDAPRAFGRS